MAAEPLKPTAKRIGYAVQIVHRKLTFSDGLLIGDDDDGISRAVQAGYGIRRARQQLKITDIKNVSGGVCDVEHAVAIKKNDF
jgi:hypothetical protein